MKQTHQQMRYSPVAMPRTFEFPTWTQEDKVKKGMIMRVGGGGGGGVKVFFFHSKKLLKKDCASS